MTQSKKLRDLMNTELVLLDSEKTALEGAKQMRDHNVGNVLVTRDGGLCGIVTDRDLVVRCMADGQDAGETRLGHFCSHEMVTLAEDSPIGDAIKLMSDRGIRRIPVVDDSNKPIGIVSLGDLAISEDRNSALGRISASEPNV